MYIREFTQKQYADFRTQLMQTAYQNPLEASYNVTISVNQTKYQLKVQPYSKCRIAVLQALQINHQDHAYKLITDSIMLLSLFEFFIRHGLPS